MLPAEGQKSKEAKIWTDRKRTCNVVSNVHSAIITDVILMKKTKQFSERLNCKDSLPSGGWLSCFELLLLHFYDDTMFWKSFY